MWVQNVKLAWVNIISSIVGKLGLQMLENWRKRSYELVGEKPDFCDSVDKYCAVLRFSRATNVLLHQPKILLGFQLVKFAFWFRLFHSHIWIWKVHRRHLCRVWCFHHYPAGSRGGQQLQQLLQDPIVAKRSRPQKARQAHEYIWQRNKQRSRSYRTEWGTVIFATTTTHPMYFLFITISIRRIPALWNMFLGNEIFFQFHSILISISKYILNIRIHFEPQSTF